jgi:hypothetical protein
MSNLIKSLEGGSHFYRVLPDGSIEPAHDSGLKEARLQNLYPSPTTVMKSTIANPGLDLWKANQLASAFVGTKQFDGEADEFYVQRVLKVADEKRNVASDFGTLLHAAIEDYPQLPLDSKLAPWMDQFAVWHGEHVVSRWHSEIMLAHHGIGIAGTCDWIGELKNVGPCILDSKSQNIKPGKRPEFYSSWCQQLSFYRAAWFAKTGAWLPIGNLVINSNKAEAPVIKMWSQEETEIAWLQFQSIVFLWCSGKPKGGYWPVGKWVPTFNT